MAKNFKYAFALKFFLAFFVMTTGLYARDWVHSPFFLRTEDGQIINPLTGENANLPYSSRQTCGACHNYDEIVKGYHFQQGWDRIKDDFNPKKPWVLSDGMMGKF
ncbi:MAG: hypothetical protein WHS38_02570 [Thermodesulforhabdaceae bacterium]